MRGIALCSVPALSTGFGSELTAAIHDRRIGSGGTHKCDGFVTCHYDTSNFKLRIDQRRLDFNSDRMIVKQYLSPAPQTSRGVPAMPPDPFGFHQIYRRCG
jgi:hypothetical protein